ncbi:hypothetical protein, partial [Bartonella sp. CM120XJJH]|uniref:hypothetical protein n=1 Tax=Bartonella sp. CM120XJJH TaxID=3243544 RepID=UPI0035D07060
ANAAKLTANSAATDAEEAQDEAREAKQAASQAKTLAEEAKTIAEQANQSLISFNLTDTSEKIELFRGILLHIYDTLKIMNLSVVAKFSPFLVAT